MSIEHRLAKLKKQNRLYRHLFIFAALVGVALVAWGHAQPIPDLIQARQFQMVNEEGDAVVAISSTPDGSGRLDVISKAGEPIITLTKNLNSGGGGILVFNKTGNGVVQIGDDAFGHGALQVCHRSENKCKGFQYAPQ